MEDLLVTSVSDGGGVRRTFTSEVLGVVVALGGSVEIRSRVCELRELS